MSVKRQPGVALYSFECPYTGCIFQGPGRLSPDEALLDGLVHTPAEHGTEPPC